MPVPTQTLWNIRRLNAVFAVSSLLALVTLLWSLAEDFERPWRGHQIQYFDNLAAAAHFDVLTLTSDEAKARREAMHREVEAEQAKLNSNAELAQLKRQHTEKTGRLANASLGFGNSNAEYQVQLFELEELKTLHGETDSRTIKMRQKVKAREAELAALKSSKNALEDDLAAIASRMKQIQASFTRAQKALSEHDKKVALAQRDEDFYGNGWKRAFFNAPGLDFLAPKGTPGRQDVQQVVLENVQQNYNFLKSYTVDRCTTCHIAIDKPTATVEQYVATCEGAMRAINERRVKAGKPPLVVPPPGTPLKKSKPVHHGHDGAALAAMPAADHQHSPGSNGHDTAARSSAQPSAPPAAQWPPSNEMSREQKKEYLALLAETVNEYMESEGKDPIEFAQPLLAHPRLDLFVSADSPHPIAKMGCTTCHEGNGQETDFMFAAHTPSSHHQEEEWAEKYVQRTWGVPQATFHLIEEYWDRPMMAAKYTSATCAKCHTQVADLATPTKDGMAEKLVEGRQLFTQIGCINCHLVEGLNDSRRVGPDLTHVNEKLDTGFLHKWIAYPANFRPSTLMPHFFAQENNLPSSANEFDPDPTLRTEVEIQAITRFLQTFSTGYHAVPTPEGIAGDAAKGEALFTSIGCLACHSNLSTVDPSDENKRTFAERWIVRDLVQSGKKPEDAAAEFKSMDLNSRIRYAMAHFTEDRHSRAMRELEHMRSLGDDSSNLYIPPYYTRFAPDLSGLASKLAPDPANAEGMQKARNWLYNWLRETRHYHPASKMPRLFTDNYYWREPATEKRAALSDADILHVVEYLLTLRHDTFQPTPIELSAKHRELAPRLIKTLLSGQYTDQAAANITMDQRNPAEPYGPLSREIVNLVSKSIGVDEAVKRLPADLFDRQMVFLGAKIITHYGCYACHTITGFEKSSPPGTELTEWGTKRLEQLDYAFFSPGYKELWHEQSDIYGWLYPKATKDSPATSEFDHLVAANGNETQQVTHSRSAFAYHKVRNPRIWDRGKIKRPYDKLKMPNFFVTPGQAEALTTFVLSRITPPLVTPALQVDYNTSLLGGVARGRHLTTELNCVACHKIEDNEPVIQQYGIVTDPSGGVMVDELNMPPWLHGEGAKVNFGWLHRFLRQVEMLRPWLNIRMPMFFLDDAQATDVVKYFATVTKKESNEVMRRLNAVHDFMKKEQASAPPSTQPSPRKPGDTWFTDPAFAGIRDFVRNYVTRYRLAKPAGLTDKDNTVEDLADNFGGAVTAAEVLGRLFDVSYPFTEPTRPTISAAQYDRGRELFLEVKCLSCHVMGDMTVAGANKSPSAPNLALTHERLSRRWVRSWLQHPAKIQPGTKMPQWWAKGGSIQSFPPEDLKIFAEKYGATEDDQMTLLEDFIYEAGRRNDAVVDPTAQLAPPPPAGEAGTGEAEFEGDGPAASQPAKPADEEFEP